MSNPVIQAFFFGRALAEVLSEKVEDAFTNVVSEIALSFLFALHQTYQFH